VSGSGIGWNTGYLEDSSWLQASALVVPGLGFFLTIHVNYFDINIRGINNNLEKQNLVIEFMFMVCFIRVNSPE
jgi:hypothetical protein